MNIKQRTRETTGEREFHIRDGSEWDPVATTLRTWLLEETLEMMAAECEDTERERSEWQEQGAAIDAPVDYTRTVSELKDVLFVLTLYVKRLGLEGTTSWSDESSREMIEAIIALRAVVGLGEDDDEEEIVYRKVQGCARYRAKGTIRIDRTKR